MSSCYKCGKSLNDGTGVLKEVYVGRSRSIGILGNRIGGAVHRSYEERLHCRECAQPSGYEVVKSIFILATLVFLFSAMRSCFSEPTKKAINAQGPVHKVAH
jgi:hypothetical protein